jgi:nicotinate-nucleotide adenylyltransferase
MKKRIGVFGGTYDPVHLGHLFVAEQCRERAQLDEIWFIPAARPPHKDQEQVTSFADRVRLLEIACQNHPAFRIDTRERDRPGPSYTVDTLKQLRGEHPDWEWFFVVGADGILDFPNWHQPQEILRLCTLCVVARPGYDVPDFALLARKLNISEAMIQKILIPTPQIDFASREIRARVTHAQSIRYMVEENVRLEIESRGLYQPKSSNKFQGNSFSN